MPRRQAGHAEAGGVSLVIRASDDVAVHARHFAPHRAAGSGASPTKAVIFLNATGATQGRFAAMAAFMARRGWHAITFDYRGIGASAAVDAHRADVSMRAWGRLDLAAVIAWADRHLGAPRIALVGHSIGGQIPPLAPNIDRVGAMLAVSAPKGHHRLWPDWRRHVVHGFFRVYVPACLRLLGRVPMPLGTLCPLPREVAQDFARWTLRADYVDQRGVSLQPDFDRFRAPVLALSFDDDALYAPRRAVDELFARFYVHAPVWRAHVRPRALGVRALRHSGFFDPAMCPAALWDDAAGWLEHALDANGGRARGEGYAFGALDAHALQRDRVREHAVALTELSTHRSPADSAA